MIPVLTQSGVIDEKGEMLEWEIEIFQYEGPSPLGDCKRDTVWWPCSDFYHCHSFAHHKGELYYDDTQNLLVCSDDSDPIDLTCGNEEVKLEPGDTYSGGVFLGRVPQARGILRKKNGTVHEGEFKTKKKG